MERKCKHCGKVFENVVGRVFSNHVRWCEKNPDRNNCKENRTRAVNAIFDAKLGTKKWFEVTCCKCHNSFQVLEREKKHPEKEIYHCSVSCANKREQLPETKAKIAATLKGRCTADRKIINCKQCDLRMDVLASSSRVFCSQNCRNEFRKPATDFLEYRRNCKFTFSIKDYPDYFDIDLIREHGWYKPKNRGDHLQGVSRDHRISIVYGWENGVDAKLISHPANCQLMVHNDNVAKHKSCSITIEELKQEIEEFNRRYKLPQCPE